MHHLACIIDGGLDDSRTAEAFQTENQTWIQYRVGIVLKDYYKKDGGGGAQRGNSSKARPAGKENHFDMRKLSKCDNKENHNQFK
jgi:hypothetical protein